MKIVKRCLLLLLSLLILFGCSITNKQNALIVNVASQDKISTKYTIKDVAFSSKNKLVYISESLTDNIWLYKEGDFFGRIGGKGVSASTFQYLTDITVTPTGNLLALDNLRKSITVFDKNGGYLKQITLDNISPYKVSLESEDMLYLYDDRDKEVILLNMLNKREFIRFGKYEIDTPLHMNIENSKLHITYDNNECDVYTNLGNFVNHSKYLLSKDSFGNKFFYKDNLLSYNNQQIIAVFPVGYKPRYLDIKGNNIILVSDKQVDIYKIEYLIK